MISKEQLNKIAQKTGLGLYQQEKEYLLKLFLYFYYKHYQDAVFKGGTCLKFLFGLDRFSEDLDFNIKNPAKFKRQVKAVLKNISGLGINNYFLKEELFKGSYTCEIGFEGPLYKGTKQTQNKFRLDAGYRTGTFQKPEWKIVKSEYPETEENFLVLMISLEELLVEKVIALVKRKKGRDLYDLWFLFNADIKLDKKLLENKTKIEKATLDFSKIANKKEYERDMSRLTNRLIPYQQVKKKVLEFLK